MNCSSLTAASVSTQTSVTSVVMLSRLPLPNPAIPPVPHILAESVSDTYVSLIIQSDISLLSARPATGAAKHGSVEVTSTLAPYMLRPVTFESLRTPKKPAPYVSYSFLLPSYVIIVCLLTVFTDRLSMLCPLPSNVPEKSHGVHSIPVISTSVINL